MRRILIISLLLSISLPSYAAETYPNKSITIVVPVSPGGSSDYVARVLCKRLIQQIGRTCIVENHAGGSEIIGTELVAHSRPDGYTLLMADPSFSIIPNWFKTTPFKIPQDFTPVSQVIASPYVFVVRSTLHVNSVKEFIALARSHPGKLNFGSAGIGGAPYMWAEQFMQLSKVKMVHIPFKGAGAAVTALLGGEIDMLMSTVPTVLADIQAGKLRALAVSGDKRIESLPTVPTMKEAGLSGMSGNAFMGVVGPAHMPPYVVNKLYSEIKKAVAVPEVRAHFKTAGAEPIGSSPAEFSKLIDSSIQQWHQVVTAGGLGPK